MDRVLPDAYRYGDFGNIVKATVSLLPQIVDTVYSRQWDVSANGPSGSRRSERSPAALRELERKAGGSAFISSHWIWNECVRLTALTGLRYATEPEKGPEILKLQEEWMIRLGTMTAKVASRIIHSSCSFRGLPAFLGFGRMRSPLSPRARSFQIQ